MTDTEIQLLAIGIAIGVDLMVLVQILFAILDDRRAAEAARRLRRINGADRFYRSLHRYQLQQRVEARQ